MNKKKYLLFLIITFIISLLLCFNNLKKAFMLNELKKEYISLKEKNNILKNCIYESIKEINILENSQEFINNASKTKKELEKEITEKQEKIEGLQNKINKIDKKITKQETKIEEIEKYLSN